MATGAEEETEVEVVVLTVAMAMVADEGMVEGDTFKTHMNLPAGAEHFWQKIVYTLQTNEYSSPRNKRIYSRNENS